MENLNINVDDVLDKFSIFGRYHMKFMLFAMFAYATNSIYCVSYIFAIEDTEYKCANEAYNNITCETVGGVQCSKWIYDKPHSFVAEFDLACQEWKKTMVGSAFLFGYMLGLLMVGPLSDRFGRKKAMVITGVIGAIIGIAKSFSPSYGFYVMMEFLGGLLGDCYSPLYVLNLEIVSPKKRVVFHFLCSIGYTIGGVLLPTAAWRLPYWRNFLRAIYAPSFLFIAFSLLDESPRWLLTKGKKEDAIAVLEKICDTNKLILERDHLNNLQVAEEAMSISFFNLLKITFKSRVLMKRFLVCLVWWTTSTFVNYGTLIHSVSLQGNKYINFGLLQLVNLPGSFIIMFILNKYKRKIPLICTFLAAAILFFVHPFLPSSLQWLSVMVYMASKLMNSFFFSITYMYTLELFPTYTRNSMHALCSALGRIGGMIAPQTPLLMAFWTHLPTVLFGGASLVAGVVTLLVPDTAEDALPDTVREAEVIGGKDKRNKAAVMGIDNLGITETIH